MDSAENKLLADIGEQFERLRHGSSAVPVDTGAVENPGLLAMAGKLNTFINSFEEARNFVSALASGNLDVEPPKRNLLASPFKHLHAALLHLTWQTCRIAKGDYNQRVHFMGDFSTAFNSMVISLRDHEEKLQDAYEELQAQSEELMAQGEELQSQNEELARLYDETMVAKEALSKARDELEARVDERTTALREKDQILIQQSRLAAMGEMIDNIAHQWRQPLNSLGLLIQSLPVLQQCGELDHQDMESFVKNCMEIISHLSQTIEDFRSFSRLDKEKVPFLACRAVEKTVSLVEPSFKMNRIKTEIITKEQPVINGFRNEYSQVLLNILQNARDELVNRNINDPRITINIGSENGRSLVTITDNAGGIPEDIIDRIFDPYFTTKENNGGSGIGLFMSKAIIEKHMGGRLTAQNSAVGASFKIEV